MGQQGWDGAGGSVYKLADKLEGIMAILQSYNSFRLPASQSWGSKQNLEMTGELLFDDH